MHNRVLWRRFARPDRARKCGGRTIEFAQIRAPRSGATAASGSVLEDATRLALFVRSAGAAPLRFRVKGAAGAAAAGTAGLPLQRPPRAPGAGSCSRRKAATSPALPRRLDRCWASTSPRCRSTQIQPRDHAFPLFGGPSPADRPSMADRVRVGPERWPCAASRGDDLLLGVLAGRARRPVVVVGAETTSGGCRPSRWLTSSAPRTAPACQVRGLLTGAFQQASRPLAGLTRFAAPAND